MHTVYGAEGPGTGGRSTEDIGEHSTSSLSGTKEVGGFLDYGLHSTVYFIAYLTHCLFCRSILYV